MDGLPRMGACVPAVSRDYIGEEADAPAARRGIWRGDFVPPWDWRRGKRLAGSRPAPKSAAGALTLSENIAYHERGSRAARVSGYVPRWEARCWGFQEMKAGGTSQRSRAEWHAAMLDAALARPSAREFMDIVEKWQERDRRLDAVRAAIAVIRRGRGFTTDRSLLVGKPNLSRGET